MRLGVLVLMSLALSTPLLAGAADTTLDRSPELAIIEGTSLETFWGTPTDQLFLFRFDTSTDSFVPIPFQVDQRFVKTFNPNTPGEFQELVFDVFNEDDGLLDMDDQIVFRFGDASEPVDASIEWPLGADDLRVAIQVEDTRPDATQDSGYVYLFKGTNLPIDPALEVDWDGSEFSSITTSKFEMGYAGRWLWTELFINSPCGTGTDLIDRWKGRVDPIIDLEQDEEDWNGNSEYLGGYSGPLRAVRYVRGARSGVNTIHSDVVSALKIKRTIRLRVHPIRSLKVYFDMLPLNMGNLFTNLEPNGVPMDGIADTLSSTPVEWTMAESLDGTLLTFWDLPSSPLYETKMFYSLDDASYDDRVSTKAPTEYLDEDDQAIGVHGIQIENTADSEITPIELFLTSFPLCGGQQGSDLATAYEEAVENPLVTTATPEGNCAASRDLQMSTSGEDVVLTWGVANMAESYRIYRSDDPSTPRAAWTHLEDVSQLTYIDEGAAASPLQYHYSVVCTVLGAEGPW